MGKKTKGETRNGKKPRGWIGMRTRENNIKRIIISFFTALCMTAAMIPIDLSAVNAEETDPALQQDTLYQEEQNDYSLASEDVPEAEINGETYSTLEMAIDAVEDGQKIKIIVEEEDLELQENLVIDKPDIKFLIDLNGKNITGTTGSPAVTITSGRVGFYDSTCEDSEDSEDPEDPEDPRGAIKAAEGQQAISATSPGEFLDASTKSGEITGQIVDFGARHSYVITTSVDPVSGIGGSITMSLTVKYGDSFIYTATPNKGYSIKQILVDGINKGTSKTGTVNWVTGAVTVKAVFYRSGLFIMLDSGHYAGYNRGYKGTGYYEGTRMWKLHLYLKDALEAYPGIVVDTTRTSNNTTYSTTIQSYERGRMAKNHDLLLSLHSNASSSSATDYVISICSTKSSVKTVSQGLGLKLAQAVRSTMGTNQGAWVYTRKNSKGTDYYGINRGAAEYNVPSVLIEHSFHTNKKMATWLMSDTNLKKLAAKEAYTVATYFGEANYPKPGKPGSFKAVSYGYKGTKLTWSKSARAEGYRIYVATKKTGTYKYLKQLSGGTNTTNINTGLKTGKTYYYRVRAYDIVGGGVKIFSSYTSKLGEKPKPAKPKNMTLKAGSKKVAVSWSSVKGATRYQIYRATSKSGKYTRIATIKGTKITNKKLKKGKYYYYKVRAYRTEKGKKTYGSFCAKARVKAK